MKDIINKTFKCVMYDAPSTKGFETKESVIVSICYTPIRIRIGENTSSITVKVGTSVKVPGDEPKHRIGFAIAKRRLQENKHLIIVNCETEKIEQGSDYFYEIERSILTNIDLLVSEYCDNKPVLRRVENIKYRMLAGENG